jgi:quercetin dioxygenase-like cupin family protein
MRSGQWFHNPITGELARLIVAPAETGGLRMEADLWLQPEAAVMGEHTHSALIEVFDVVAGSVGFRLDGEERTAGPGTAVTIPVGARHAWWNAGEGQAHVRFSLESADARRPMAARFLSMIETAWGLAAAGKTNAKGMPDPLWLAALAHEYRDVVRFVQPPAAVQSALFAPLSALARRLGRDPLDPALHGEDCPACIPPLEDDAREALLAARAPAGGPG